ncbi:DUF6388 family protein [Pantoea agglomerans]
MSKEEKYHREVAEALGMTWEEYLEINPELKDKFSN